MNRSGGAGSIIWKRRILLGAAALFILLGAARGETDTVFVKATRICMECIGIG